MRPVRTMIKAMFTGMGVYLCWLLLPNLLYLGGVLLFPQAQEELLTYLGFFGTALAALMVMGIFAMCGKGFREAVCWEPRRATWKAHAAAVAFGVCVNTAVSALLTLLPLPEELVGEYVEQSQGLYDPSHAALSLAAVVVLAPVFEEILFRGYLFRSFLGGFPFWAAAGASAALFGIAHGQPLWICYAAGMGLLFSVISQRGGTLTLSIAAHVGFNVTAVPQLLWPNVSQSVPGLVGSGVAGAVGAVLLWRVILPKEDRAAG